jgi:hypothetical protein
MQSMQQQLLDLLQQQQLRHERSSP